MKEWNILDFGARCSDALQTRPIQDAIDACFLAGGGRVVIPCGVFYTGGLRIRSGVELYLEAGAILRGSRDWQDYFGYTEDKLEPVDLTPKPNDGSCPSTWPTSRWCNALIRAFDAHDFAVIGEKGSYIDGVNCYDPMGEQRFRGPHGMCFWRCSDIRLEGYTFLNSANWCHAIFQSHDITIRGIKLRGGHDGVYLRTCDNALIEDCEFLVGDDALAGFDNHDIVMRNCILNTSCIAIRFGGNNVTVENCRADASPFGHRKKLSDEGKVNGWMSDNACRHAMQTPFSYYCDHRAVIRRPIENFTIKNCSFEQAFELIRVEFDGLHRWCCNRSMRQVSYENCTVKRLSETGMIWGDANEKITCHFKNLHISCEAGRENIPLLVAGNFDKIVFEDCTIEGYTEPTILLGTEGEVEIIRSTPITLKRASFEECLDAHPHGIFSEDLKLGRSFQFR
jgi:hypothetical protein